MRPRSGSLPPAAARRAASRSAHGTAGRARGSSSARRLRLAARRLAERACVTGGTDTSDDARFYLGTEKAVLFNTAEEGLTEAEAAQRLVISGP